MANQKELEQRLQWLEKKLAQYGISLDEPSADPKDRPDYIEFGSDRHAALLGLRKATQEDTLQKDGWTLIDRTVFGPQVTDDYLREVLRQKVEELNSEVAMPQSEDRNAPNYAPPMWRPSSFDTEVSGLV